MFQKLFSLFMLFCIGASFIRAQTVTYNFESPRRATGAANASISGAFKFPNETPMSWTLNYNSTEKKPVSMSFVRPEFIPFNVFSVEIQAMTAGEFGGAITNCLLNNFSTFILCAADVWGQAMTDCAFAEPEVRDEHCWMHGNN